MDNKGSQPQVTRALSSPQDFDIKAKENLEKVSRVHEFRRQNIEPLEAPQSDLFEYDEDDTVSRRYDALKLENIFRYNSTFRALKWGVGVGSLFAAHRYYRSRSINNAAHWFSVMSAISFFNIWMSFSIQEFITEYGSRKSLSLTQRNAYHQDAYKSYVDKIQKETYALDMNSQPVLQNDIGEALDTFATTYVQIQQKQSGTDAITRKQLLQNLAQKTNKDSENNEYGINANSLDYQSQNKQQEIKFNGSTKMAMKQRLIFVNDTYTFGRQFQVKTAQKLDSYFSDVTKRTSQMDLTHFNFNQDPDCSVNSKM